MTMKKIPTYIAAFVLGALVLSGCSNVFFEKPRQYGGEAANPDIPKGFGTVQVSLSRGAARTIIPAADLAGLYLEYWFAKDSGEPKKETPTGNIFTLKPGSYTLEVKAFVDDGYADLAASGETDTAFTIAAETAAAPVNVTLHPVVDGAGVGELEFSLVYPAGVMVETFTLTRIAGEEPPIDLTVAGTSSGSGPVTFNGTDGNIPVGYYLLRVVLKNTDTEGASSGRAEVVHIYQNLKSEAHYVFIADDFRAYRVTTNADSGPGSLRQALTNENALVVGGLRTIQILLEPGSVIALESTLPDITRNLIIEGNGVTLTRAVSWTSSDASSQLLRIFFTYGTGEVAIRRVHFKNGLATNYGGAIDNFSGTLTLESCIFSGNRTISTSGNANGGAIYNDNSRDGTLTVRGSTFYNNSAGYIGDAIYNRGTLNLTGNVFYGNAVSNTGTVTSGGYNVSDKESGASGWAFAATDVQAAIMPVGPVSFKPLLGLSAAGRITTRPENYPTVDFYGDPIPGSSAHAGAVQGLASGYHLDSRVIGPGSITVISGTGDADSVYPSGTTVKLRAVLGGGGSFGYWKVDGVVQSVQTPATEITLTMNGHKTVEAWIVDPSAVTKVEFGASNTKTVSFSGLANRSVFLVKVNKGNTNVEVANSGSVVGAGSLPLTSMAPSFASSSNAIGPGFELPFMDHPGAMEFNANPPPITAAMRQGRRARSVAPLSSPAVGVTRTFWVETVHGNGNSDEWTQKQATLRAAGTYGNVWVMDDAYSATDGGTSDLKITAAQAEALAQKFDLIYPVETKLLGYEYGGGVGGDGGQDGDLKVQILVYDFMGGTEGTSGSAGFFWAKDFSTQDDLDQSPSGVYKTNLAEIFYLSVSSVDSSPDYMYSALVHEFQHMINFNQKRVVHNITSEIPSWYNEMLSLMAEDVISPLIGIGPDNSSHAINTRTGTFLNSYNTEGITEWGTLESTSYAKGFAFGAYLMRNWGGAELLSKILANDSVGIPSVTAALNEIEPGMTFEKAVQRYGEALIFSGASKSAGVLSFDNTVDYTLSGTTYTASAFDIWTMGGPTIFPLTDTSELKAYGLIVQSADAWINKTGSLSITLNKPSSPDVELYVMVR
jgi:hypothetical protein